MKLQQNPVTRTSNKSAAAALALLAVLTTPSSAGTVPETTRAAAVTDQPRVPTATGRTWAVNDSAAFQDALAHATCGDEIVLGKGSFTGRDYALPPTSCPDFQPILVRTADSSKLPKQLNWKRSHIALLAHIVGTGTGPALAIPAAASGWYFLGLDIEKPSGPVIISSAPTPKAEDPRMGFGSDAATNPDQTRAVSGITFDRCDLQGEAVIAAQNGPLTFMNGLTNTPQLPKLPE